MAVMCWDRGIFFIFFRNPRDKGCCGRLWHRRERAWAPRLGRLRSDTAILFPGAAACVPCRGRRKVSELALRRRLALLRSQRRRRVLLRAWLQKVRDAVDRLALQG